MCEIARKFTYMSVNVGVFVSLGVNSRNLCKFVCVRMGCLSSVGLGPNELDRGALSWS